MSETIVTATDDRSPLTAMLAGNPDADVLHAPRGRSLTLGALLNDVHAVTSLCATSLDPGQRAAFVVRDGLAAVPTFLGIAAHCGCVPLDANLPAARLTRVPRRARRRRGARALRTRRPRRSRPPRHAGDPCGCWNGEPTARSTAPRRRRSNGGSRSETTRPRAGRAPHWSSRPRGSTGPPKGVSQPLAHLVAGAENVADALGLDERDRCLNPMPLFHIHGLIAGVLAPLSRGGSVLVCHGADEADTVETWRTYRPTWTTAVPTRHLATLTALQAAKPPIDVSAVRLLRTASAPMQAALQQALEDFFDAPVIEAYGMTEATHQIASNPVDRAARRVGSVGRPRGFEVEIRDVDGEARSLSVGEEGAVWIRGNTLMRGYDGRRGAAAGIAAGGWFDTGDLGRLDVDGYLHLTGRRSETINRGGEKVQPLVVDRVLQSHPAIDAAVTFAHPHPTLHQDVVAAALLRPGAERPSEEELRASCFAELPPYQVPTRVLVLDELPSTSTGKLSRRLVAEALAPMLDAAEERASETPVGELEATVATRMAAELSAPDSVRRDDNFFMLGGDSLSGVRVIARLARELDIVLAPDALFRHPTPATLAAAIRAVGTGDGAGSDGIASSVVAADPPAADALPLPDGMADYWFQERLEPPTLARHRITRLPLAATIPDERLRRTLDVLVSLHPVFRLRIQAQGRRATGRLGAPYRVPLLDVERSGVEAFASTPFDLDNGPLLRACRIRGDAANDVLILCAHHLTMDAQSEQVLADWIATALASPTEIALTADNIAGAERVFIGALRDVAPSETERERAIRAAVAAVGDAPLPVPATIPRPKTLERAQDTLDSHRAPDTTPAAAVAGLWHRVRVDAGASPDTVYRLVTSVRTAGDSTDACGFFVNIVPLRLDFPAGTGPRDAVRHATLALANARSRQAGTVSAIARSKGTRELAAAIRAAPLLNIDTTASGRKMMPGTARSTFDDSAPEGSLEYRVLEDGKACLRLWSARDHEEPMD